MATEGWIPLTVWDGKLIDSRSNDFETSTEESRKKLEEGKTKVIPCFEIGTRKTDPIYGIQAKIRGRS